MSYLLTREHLEHVRCEKGAYTRLDNVSRCIYLAKLYNKRYEYDYNIGFHECKTGIYKADISNHVPAGDLLVNLIVKNKITSANVIVRNNNQEKEYTVSSCHDTMSSPIDIPVPIQGIPLVALQYATVHLRVECPVHPEHVTCTFAILPKYERTVLAQIAQTIKVFHQIDDGTFMSRQMYIFSGNIADKPLSPCCTIM